MKKILLSLIIASGLTQTTQAQVSCDMMNLIVNVSDTGLVKLYHPGHYLTWPRSENVIVWEITDSQGNIIADDTLINNSDFLFYHNIIPFYLCVRNKSIQSMFPYNLCYCLK